MSPSQPSKQMIASDGLMARDNGAWGKVKLNFLDDFLPPALTATRKKTQRYFVDLFAGPGLNVTRGATNDEFWGGTIRAMQATDGRLPSTTFTHLVAVNLEPEDHAPLVERVKRITDAGQTKISPMHQRLILGDCNHHIEYELQRIDLHAYVFVFADPTAPKSFPFSTVRKLRQHGHRSVDLYMLYPGDMALRRLFGAPETNEQVLTRFYGGDGWKPFVAERVTDQQFGHLMRRAQEYYCDQLRSVGWAYVQIVRDVRRSADAGLYDMILASNHPAGERIGSWAAEKEATRDQLGLDFSA